MNDPLASCGCKNTLSIGVYANDVVSGHNKHTHTHTHIIIVLVNSPTLLTQGSNWLSGELERMPVL